MPYRLQQLELENKLLQARLDEFEMQQKTQTKPYEITAELGSWLSPPSLDGGIDNEDQAVSTVIPRRKARASAGQSESPSVRRRRMAPVRISLEVLDKLSSLSLSAAAFRLGISPTAMKKSCRKLGVTRWPYQSGKTSSATTIEGSRENTAPNAKYPAHLVENTAVSLAYQSNSGTFSSDSSSSRSPTPT